MPKFSRIIPGFFLVLLIIFIVYPCRADIDYRNVITESINYSAILRVKKQDVLISHAQYKSNFAGLYPEISIGGRAERYENIDNHENSSVNIIGGETIGGSQSAWKSSLSVSGQYYLSNWYKKRYEAGFFEKLRDTSIHDCESEEKKMIREVTDIFRSVIESKISLKYSNEILLRLSEISRLKKEAFAKGQFSYEDVLKAQTDVLNTQKDISALTKEFRENLEKLSNYTGKMYAEYMEFTPLPFNGKPPAAFEDKVIEQTPEYKARRKELEAYRFKDKSTGNNFLPDISIYGRYDLYHSSPKNIETAINNIEPIDYSAGVYISIPFFDGGARKWQRIQTVHELKKAEENARLVLNEKNKEIKTLQIGYAELFKSYDHYKKIQEQYEKIMEMNKKSQRLGERSTIDIYELEKDALAVERDLKIVEHTLAVYERQLSLELNFNEVVGDYGGNGTCKY